PAPEWQRRPKVITGSAPTSRSEPVPQKLPLSSLHRARGVAPRTGSGKRITRTIGRKFGSSTDLPLRTGCLETQLWLSDWQPTYCALCRTMASEALTNFGMNTVHNLTPL